MALLTEVSRPTAPRLFLVDGYALIYRAFFAFINRPLSTSRGENTSIAWGIANFLRRLIDSHQPELLAWVHDSGTSFRDELYPDYKATREKLTEDLQVDFDSGLERVLQLLAAYDIPVLSAPGYEADDVIGTMAMRGVEAGYNVVIVSGDKDFQQLVRPGIWLLNPGRGGPAGVEETWVGMENAKDRLGVSPAHVVDFLALVGDTSDNVPGVKGIGQKGAQELIAHFGALENILDNLDKVTKKRSREALKQYADIARVSKQLVTIHCDVPIPFEPGRLAVNEPDMRTLQAIYHELEFTSLMRQAGEALLSPGPDIGRGSTTPDPASHVKVDIVATSEKNGTADDMLSNGSVTLTASGRMARPAVVMGESGVPVLADARYMTVDTMDTLDALLERVRRVPYIAIDTETVTEAGAPFEVDALRSRLVGLSIAVSPGEAYYLPFSHRREEGGGNLALLSGDTGIVGRRIREGAPEPINLPPIWSDACARLRFMLADAEVKKIAQNAKYDVLVLRNSGVSVCGIEFDTMVASYVLDPGRRLHGLDVLAYELLGHTMTSYTQLVGKGRTKLPFDVSPVDTARDYSCEDVDITMRLRDKLEIMLADHMLLPLMREIEVPLISVLAAMEWEGIAIDRDWFGSLKMRFTADRARVEKMIYEEAGREFNINSNPQLRAILFGELGLPVRKKTATGPSTDASVLQELADEGHVLPALLMEYREIFKLEGTYIDALPRLVNPRDQRLHTSYSQTVSATGRLSSHDPNLQNIPIRSELGRDIRRGFVPRKGWRLLSADYSQIELRILAHLSDDPAFVSAFRAGGDIHRQTAAIIFGMSVDDVTVEMRGRAKTINFATIYGQGAHALSRQLRVSHAEAKSFIDTYFERFSGVRAFLDQCIVDARARGYVETLFRRRRYIPELKDRNFNIRAFGERVAQNAPIQGSAADLIKIAMIRIQDALTAEKLAARMLLQVHDELVFELPPDEIEALSMLVKTEMEGAASLTVPLLVEIGVGTDWVAAKA